MDFNWVKGEPLQRNLQSVRVLYLYKSGSVYNFVLPGQEFYSGHFVVIQFVTTGEEIQIEFVFALELKLNNFQFKNGCCRIANKVSNCK